MTTKKNAKPASERALRKSQKMWDAILADGRVCMTPAMAVKKFGANGLKFELPIDKKGHLLGSCPKCLNLHEVSKNLDISSYGKVTDNDYIKLNLYGKPPPANLYISYDVNLTELYIPEDVEYDYIALENLPNLKKIVISKKVKIDKTPLCDKLNSIINHEHITGLRWLLCKDLPNLKSIEVEGGLVWLRVQNVPDLTSIKLFKASSLSYFYIEHAPALKTLRFDQCVKLKSVDGMGAMQRHQLSIETKINRIQKSISRFDASIYANMTFTDVEIVLDVLNQGWSESARRGLLAKDHWYLKNMETPLIEYEISWFKMNPGFESFSIDVLQPLDYSPRLWDSSMIPTFKRQEKTPQSSSSSFESDDEDETEEKLDEEDPIGIESWGQTTQEAHLLDILSQVQTRIKPKQLAERADPLPDVLRKLYALIDAMPQ